MKIANRVRAGFGAVFLTMFDRPCWKWHCRWCAPERASDGRSEVGQGIAEQLRADDDVEPHRIRHHSCDQRVDVFAFNREIGKFRGNRRDPFIPVRHHDGDPVQLRDRGQLAPRALRRQCEDVPQASVHPNARHHGFLQYHFTQRTCEHLP